MNCNCSKKGQSIIVNAGRGRVEEIYHEITGISFDPAENLLLWRDEQVVAMYASLRWDSWFVAQGPEGK